MSRLHFRFMGFDCATSWERYQESGRTALRLVSSFTDGGHTYEEPVTTATVNLPDQPMDADETAIKDWSENAGIVDALVGAGLIHEPHREVPNGYVLVPVARWRRDAAGRLPWEEGSAAGPACSLCRTPVVAAAPSRALVCSRCEDLFPVEGLSVCEPA